MKNIEIRAKLKQCYNKLSNRLLTFCETYVYHSEVVKEIGKVTTLIVVVIGMTVVCFGAIQGYLVFSEEEGGIGFAILGAITGAFIVAVL